MSMIAVYFAAGLTLVFLSLISRTRRIRRNHKQITESIALALGSASETVIFPDPRYRRKTLNWGTEGLDTTYFGLNTLRRLEKKGWEVNLKELIPRYSSGTVDFVLRHFDNETGGARHHLNAWPTIYGTYCALGTIRWLYGDSSPTKVFGRDRAKEWLSTSEVDRLIEFVSRCRVQDGGFAGSPGRSRATIIDTDAALGILWNLEHKPENRRGIREFILSCRRAGDSQLGFVNMTEETEPCCCMTSYAIRALLYLDAIETGDKDIKETLKRAQTIVGEDNLQKVSHLLKACFRDDESMFGKTPHSRATLYHTDMALSFLKSLRENLDIGSFAGMIRPDKTFETLEKFHTREGGFSFAEGLSANIHSTRSAVQITRIFQELRLTNGTEQGYEVVNPKSVKKFLESCYNPAIGAFSGYRLLFPSR